jgi:hypothetical protein
MLTKPKNQMNLIFRTAVFLVITALCTTLSMEAQQNGENSYRTTRITTPPVIDGTLDDEAWRAGQWEDGFTQYEPHNGREVSQRTEFMILYDDDNIYVAIKAYDAAPDSIVRRLTRRDNLDGDYAGVSFDSYHDGRTAFMLSLSAGGVKRDLMITNDGDDQDATWDPNWDGKTTVNDQGWVAEMRIPFSQLRFESNSNGIWGMQVFRSIYRHSEMNYWQPIPRDAPGMVHHYGLLEGLENIEPRKVFDVTPYAVTSLERYPSQAGNPYATGRDLRLAGGVDAKIGVTHNLTLDLTINPDFGQVEADPSEVNLSAFETFFEEKRPFFVEGRNISSFGLGIGDGGVGNDNLFYSRRIGRRPQGRVSLPDGAYTDMPQATSILGAAKLTGKTEKGLSLAFISSVTAEEKAVISHEGTETTETVEPLTAYTVGRVQKDFNDGTTIIGGIFTGVNRKLTPSLEDMLHESAFSGGVDFTQYFRDKTWMFNVNAAFSHVSGSEKAMTATQRSSARYFQRPDADHLQLDSLRGSMSGSGGRVQLMRSGNSNWYFIAVALWRSPSFEINDIGFMREADNFIQALVVGYNQWEPNGIYRRYNINGAQYNAWNFGGQYLMSGGNINGSITFSNFWNMNVGTEITGPSLSATMLRGGPMMKMPTSINTWYGIGTDSRKKLVLRVNGGFNKGFNDNYNLVRISPGVTWKPSNTMSLSLSPAWSESTNRLQYIGRRSLNGNDCYLFGEIKQQVVSMSLRVNLNLTPDLTLQYWGQPFVASGEYSEFKRITDPMADSYGDRFEVFPDERVTFEDNRYRIDENGNGSVDYHFRNPDFNVREFLSNLVLRWEYNPGSSIFLVWSQTRSGFDQESVFSPVGNMSDLFSEGSHNTFLVKFSYRFGL